MNPDQIVISETGVTILGFPVGLVPKTRDFELAFEGHGTRNQETTNAQRKLRICDSKGLSWLADLKFDCVLWLQIRLAPIRHRKQSDVDPAQYFGGKVRIGRYTIQGPFSYETGEIVRRIKIAGLEVHLVSDEKRVRAITVGFSGNEPPTNRD